jgi:phosphatidate cytidylyltransferase
MLRQRLITALILLVVVSSIIYLAPFIVFQIGAALLLLAATWEWGGLLGDKYNNLPTKVFLLVAVTLAYLGSMHLIPLLWALWAGTVMVVWGLVAVIAYSFQKKPAGFQFPLLKALACVLLIVPTMVGLDLLRDSTHGRGLVFYALTLAMVNDSAAYFAGRWVGRKKLAPLVSPKKTWEGCVCGVMAGIIWSMLVTLVFWPEAFHLLPMIVIATPALIAAVVGDLFISVLKRQINMKDTGTLLPGHGGLLDRIDAVIMTIPVFAWVALEIGVI